MSKEDAQKLVKSIESNLQAKDNKEYANYIDEVLTDSSKSIPGYVPGKR
jgi:hypothetical protein